MVATPEKQYRVIGTRPIRPDGTDKVTGRAEYGTDVRLPGMLFGRMKRSPYAHANIKRIDATKALALPGVKAVLTRADFPDPGDGLVPGEGPPVSARFLSDNVMADKKALYRGHPVAAVCANEHPIGEAALAFIEVGE